MKLKKSKKEVKSSKKDKKIVDKNLENVGGGATGSKGGFAVGGLNAG